MIKKILEAILSVFENQESKNEKQDSVNLLSSIVYAGMGLRKRDFDHVVRTKDTKRFGNNAILFDFECGNSERAQNFGWKLEKILGGNCVEESVWEIWVIENTYRAALFNDCFRIKKKLLDSGYYKEIPDEILIRHQPMFVTILNTINQINEYLINDKELIRECLELLSEFIEDVAEAQRKKEELIERDKEAIANSLKEHLAFEREIIELRKSRMSKVG